MIAQTQYKLEPTDLQTLLALVRCGSLAAAAERLNVDASTVFRNLQRIERGLGQALFDRSRAGYAALDLALTLAQHAEQMETLLESAQSAAQLLNEQVSGTVRITTTDTILHGLVAPALKELRVQHPLLAYELHTGNELTSLTRRDADIAVRATKQPPQHLVGKSVGPIRVAVFAAKNTSKKRYAGGDIAKAAWIAVDDALPEHPSVVWRKRRFPKVVPTYRVNSVLTVMELVSLGLGVGVLPLFLARGRADLAQVSNELDDAQTELWLLTHPESRHLRRVSAVYGHLVRTLILD
jgi:DNA-binding transcriptional LysR family regulator